jgi:hypothetical protein
MMVGAGVSRVQQDQLKIVSTSWAPERIESLVLYGLMSTARTEVLSIIESDDLEGSMSFL